MHFIALLHNLSSQHQNVAAINESFFFVERTVVFCSFISFFLLLLYLPLFFLMTEVARVAVSLPLEDVGPLDAMSPPRTDLLHACPRGTDQERQRRRGLRQNRPSPHGIPIRRYSQNPL